MIISTYYPIWGGAQRQLIQLCEHLKPNVDLFILTRRTPGTKKQEIINGIEVHRVFVTNRFIFLDSLLFTFLSLLWLLRNKNRFDILHCHQLHSPSMIGLLGKFLLKKRVIAKVTRSGEYGEMEEIARLPFHKVRISLLKHLDRIVVLNNEMDEELRSKKFSVSKIRRIPNGVRINENNKFSEPESNVLRSRFNLPKGIFVIYTGQINRTKGVQFLLEAWRLISQEAGNAHLLLVGSINDPKMVDYFYGQERVHSFGMVEDVSQYLKVSDIFVLPSLSEGLSNSLLEAMANGLAIVATNIAGNKEVIINKKNGLLVNKRDIKELANAVVKLINNYSLRNELGQQALLNIRSYDINKIAEAYLALYEEVSS